MRNGIRLFMDLKKYACETDYCAYFFNPVLANGEWREVVGVVVVLVLVMLMLIT